MREIDDGQYEIVTDNQDVEVKIYLSDEPAGYVPLHWHRHLEIVLVLSGEVTFEYEQHQTNLTSDEFIILGSGILHRSENTANQSIVIQIPISFLSRYCINPELVQFDQMKIKQCQHTAAYADIVTSIHTMYRIYVEKDSCYQLQFAEYLMRCLYTMLKNFTQPQLAIEETDDQRLKTLLGYINQHYVDKLNVHDLALQYHYHPDYLSRYFKKKTGIALNRYIYLVRLAYVHREIIHTEKHIHQIFLENGITNIRLGTRLFEQYYGQSPHQIRKFHQK
ncbi:AraC family transcriptional regulator [Weissella diestrammenae]|uniref:AraC family transcriptional regulator n=1 Tax=Weissella diestrammenae TaxID=1162633 RepID=A0A7G9T3L8_9LACO|nr:helix-turn-helix domain-containing protein [Weissella diestrammenae]MCM0582669.1 AraC family transcriptional regulator [Weissella diestrammenae]QNN74693.1 AraC family transcriptional regulator [Weissella diestrammenae]